MRKEQNCIWNKISLGTCYYPEHWDKSMWKDDLRRMKENGITTVRIAEFAWNKIEPQEGVYTYEFFDLFLEMAHEQNIQVIFGTPTAAPPAWLAEKYPEILNCRKDGVHFRHGMRRHYNYNSPVYQQYCANIVEKVATHYGLHPAIIGWQIDNELNCEINEFYSESDTLAFREFLKKKYQTLDNLNQAWGTVFWNQTYISWNEIFVPRVTVQNSANPHLMLDYRRFISESTIQFCKMQCDIIRKYKKPNDFITTNGIFDNLDNHRMMDECLDVYTYDSYPNFAFGLDEKTCHDKMKDRKWSRNLMEVRSVCPHFGIMEQQSGANGWDTRMETPAPKPGQMMLWTMQSIAHGADYISYFRWRTCRFGTEMYWHGILNYDNRDNRRLAEVQRIWERVQKLEGVAGAVYEAKVGLLRDYDNRWDAATDRWHERIVQVSEKAIFEAAQLTHTPLDSVYLTELTDIEDLCKYTLLFYPHPLIADEKTGELLKAYVQQGGILILGARSGQKNRNGHCVDIPMPGIFAELTGTYVDDFTFKGVGDDEVLLKWKDEMFSAGIFQDLLSVQDSKTTVLASYENTYFAKAPALVERCFDKGKVLHFGGTFTEEIVRAMLSYACVMTPETDTISLPESCELAVRVKEKEKYYFVLNYTSEVQHIQLKEGMEDVDTGKDVKGQVTLSPYETKVYKIYT